MLPCLGCLSRLCLGNPTNLFSGAMKSNIGHLEGASGVADVIKAIQILETGVIPPNVNIEHLNPDIDADYLRLKV